MIDDDRGGDARPHDDAGREFGARPDESRPHHMVESDGELLDIGPDAETIDDASLRATERIDLDDAARREDGTVERTPRAAPKFGSAGSGGAEYEPGPERP